MPGLITNYLFGERAYQSLSPNYLKEIIRKNPNAYHMGPVSYTHLDVYKRQAGNRYIFSYMLPNCSKARQMKVSSFS